MVRLTTTRAALNDWRVIKIGVLKVILIILTISPWAFPGIVKKEIRISGYIWFGAALGFGMYTKTRIWAAKASFQRREQLGLFMLKFVSVVVCIVTICFAFIYYRSQNQTISNIVELCKLVILSGILS